MFLQWDSKLLKGFKASIYTRWLSGLFGGFVHLMEKVNFSWIFNNISAMSGAEIGREEREHVFMQCRIRARHNFGRSGNKKKKVMQ